MNKRVKLVFGVVAAVMTALLPMLLGDGKEPVVVLAIAPFVLPAISAGISGLMNLFGGNEEEERYKKMLAMLNMQEQNVVKGASDATANLERMSTQEKKQRRDATAMSNAKSGMENPVMNYGNEEDIINALYRGVANIDANKQASLNEIAGKKAEVEAGYSGGESDFSRFFGGAIKGGNLGFDINNSFGIGEDSMGGGLAEGLKNVMKVGKLKKREYDGSLGFLF